MTDTCEMNVNYFRNLVQDETSRLTQLCEKWSKILEARSQIQQDVEFEQQVHDEDSLGAIRTTIGQAKLLMAQRFKQFNSLIDDCEFKKSQLPTRLEDLLGFWEMINCQIKDVTLKFESLDQQPS